MVELDGCTPTQLPVIHNQQMDDILNSNDNAHFHKLGLGRSVTFEEEEDINRDDSLTSISQVLPSNNKRSGLPHALRPLVETRLYMPTKDYAKVKFLSICPREELTFNHVNGENDLVDVMVLKNESVRDVVFKIKITSPEKFRVRPSTGTIAFGGTEFIRIYLQNEFRNSVRREKLLLMAVETSEESNENFVNVWKNSSAEQKIEYKLRCRLSAENVMATSIPELIEPTAKVNEINRKAPLQKKLETTMVYRQNIIMISMAFIIIVLQLLSLIWQHQYFTSVFNMQKDFCFKFASFPSNPPFESDL